MTNTARTPLAIACLLFAAIFFCLVPNAVQPAHADVASGEIWTVDDLKDLATQVNGNSSPSKGKTYTLMADIDLSGETSWTPIGQAETFNDSNGKGTKSFQGIFDGNGYTISGLTIESLQTGQFGNNSGYTIGLFGCTNGATIKNLNLENVAITDNQDKRDKTKDLCVGALAGLAIDTVVEYCNVDDFSYNDATGAYSANKNCAVGGIAGDVVSVIEGKTSSISSCSVIRTTLSSAARTNQQDNAYDANNFQLYVGGLAGRLRAQNLNSPLAKLSRCSFQGELYGYGFVGPIAAGGRGNNTSTTTGSAISLAASNQLEYCYYAAIMATDTNSESVNKSFNCGNGVWSESGSYLKATELTSDNINSSLNALNNGSNRWRTATFDDNSQVLVLDYRSIKISAPSFENNKATYSYERSYGYYESSDGVSLAPGPWSATEAGSRTESAALFTVPLASADQTITLANAHAYRNGSTGGASTATLPAATDVSLIIAKTRNSSNVVTALTASLSTGDERVTTSAFSYQWYGTNDEKLTALEGETKQTLSITENLRTSYGSFQCVATSKTAALDNSFTVKAEERAAAVGTVVYVKYSFGKDSDAGTKDAPVKTLQRAYEVINSRSDKANSCFDTIIIMDEYSSVAYGFDKTTFCHPATITSYDADDGTDYRKSGAKLYLYSSKSGQDSSTIGEKLLYANTVFKNITLSGNNSTSTSNTNIGYIYCQGYNLTMDVGVKMEGYRNSKSGSYGQLSDSLSYDFNIVGGFFNWDYAPGTAWEQYEPQDGCNIVIKSGSYARIIAGNRNYNKTSTSFNSISHNQFGSEEHPFVVSVTIDIADDRSQRSDGFNCDVAQVCGGQTDGTIYANSTVTVKNGVVPLVLGASIGFGRDLGSDSNGNKYPNNDFVGTAAVNIEGSFVSQVYGGCLGRYNNNLVVDSRFKSSVYTDVTTPDIAINISGGTIGKIGNIGGSNVLTGIFTCGAGGITGQKNDHGATTNTVDVKLAISGGSIAGNVYGGGYGLSSGAPKDNAAFVNPEAGNLYGSSTVVITGGTVTGNVYGGGSGTTAYLANTKTSALAQIVGDVSLSVKDATIKGSIYGGSQGALPTSGASACVDMAKITGNVTLAIDNSAITGSVYGGSALGTITGNATTTISDSNTSDANTITGSIYGGGEGKVLAGDDLTLVSQKAVGLISGSATLDISNYSVGGNVYGGGAYGAVLGAEGTTVKLSGTTVGGSVYGGGQGSYLEGGALDIQKVIGQVKGNASLEIIGHSTISGNVYGGGSLGIMGNGSFTSGTTPYAVSSEAKVSVLVNQAIIKGAVFGGGEGDAAKADPAPRLLGAVFGSCSTTIYDATISFDVFGGGNQSFVYAPLDNDGNPQQATRVVINADDAIIVNADGSVASTSGSSTRTIDEPSNVAAGRTISLGGSVFGGGNIADPNVVRANNITVYGDTEVFIKGEDVMFTGIAKGGVYGDGNLSTAKGERFITLIDLRTPTSQENVARKSFFSLQRADRAVVHNTDINLKGARDLVSESDTTVYSLNRVSLLKLYANSTLEFDTVVNGLGELWSDVLTGRIFTSSSGGALTTFGDNVTDSEKTSYRTFCEKGGSWTDKDGATHTSANAIIVNNGKWLDVKRPDTTSGDYPYGKITGLFSLTTNTAADGGAFVFGQYQSTGIDCPGTFVSLNKNNASASARSYLGLYTQTCVDVNNRSCRTWYVQAKNYTYTRTIKAYALGGENAEALIYLPVAKGNSNQMKLTSNVTAEQSDDKLKDLKNSKDDAEKTGGYYFDMAFGQGGNNNALPLYDRYNNATFAYDYSGTFATSIVGLVPLRLTLHMDEVGENMDAQSGMVSFTLTSTNGETYTFNLTIDIQEQYATATENAHYGRVYENIAVRNLLAITPNSSFTAQYTTTYCPKAYKNLTSVLSTSFSADLHGKTGSGSLPAGTKITMVDVSEPNRPQYYSCQCATAQNNIKLTDFVSMSGAGTYTERNSYTVVTESLLFIIDYSSVAGGAPSGTAYLTLSHRHGSDNNKDGLPDQDILRYEEKERNEQGEYTGKTIQHYNTLTTEYPIIANGGYFSTNLAQPPSAAGTSAGSLVVLNHTDNFMYDTYTVQLNARTATDRINTTYDENDIALALSFQRNIGSQLSSNTTLPLGSHIVVTRNSDGTILDTRYCLVNANRTDHAYAMVNLGSRPNDTYTIEIRIARYLEGGAFFKAFDGPPAWGQIGITLNADLYLSADGEYFDGASNPTSLSQTKLARLSTLFTARGDKNESEKPQYELNVTESQALLTWNTTSHKVEGTLPCTKNTAADVTMTVLRKRAGTNDEPIDITTTGGTVVRSHANDAYTFAVTDAPTSDTYEYEIRLGNTVYYQTVTVS